MTTMQHPNPLVRTLDDTYQRAAVTVFTDGKRKCNTATFDICWIKARNKRGDLTILVLDDGGKKAREERFIARDVAKIERMK